MAQRPVKMMNPNWMQAWLQFWTEAMKGPAEAQAAFQSLMEAWPADPSALTGFTPPDTSQQETYRQWLEEMWKAMGVVPRQRYLELLERNEQLRQRLEEAEETIQRLQDMIGEAHRAEVDEMLDAWQTAVARTLAAQSEWMRLWSRRTPDERTGDPE